MKFVKKFNSFVKLKELQSFAKPGGVLQNMQVLKAARLSVSKVSKKEWDFILELADENPASFKTSTAPDQAEPQVKEM